MSEKLITLKETDINKILGSNNIKFDKIKNFFPHLKLISRGENRDEAISIMHRALNEIIIEGIDTNIDLHKWILKQDIFTTGQYNTNWLEKNISNFH